MDQSDKDRKLGREWAEEEYAFVQTQNADFKEGYTRQVKRFYAEVITPPTAMTEKEAIEFEAESIEFGKYWDKTWGTAPVSYVEWLADKSRRLIRYVQSRCCKMRENDDERC